MFYDKRELRREFGIDEVLDELDVQIEVDEVKCEEYRECQKQFDKVYERASDYINYLEDKIIELKNLP